MLFDQRGAGRSRPLAEVAENTTQHLVSDIETLRERFAIPKWHMVFGGSWGTTLGLLYAQTHPERVGSIVLRGVLTGREKEFDSHQGLNSVSGMLYPDKRERFRNFIPEDERGDIGAAYYKRLVSDDPDVVYTAAREWNRWDLSLGSVKVDPADFEKLEDKDWCITHARLEAHYFVNRIFLEEGHLLKEENMAKIQHIPGNDSMGKYFHSPIHQADAHI